MGGHTLPLRSLWTETSSSRTWEQAALTDVDTSLLRPPYHPAISKPFHVIKEWTKFGNTFKSSVVMQADSKIAVKCMFGRDGNLNDLDSEVLEYTECAMTTLFVMDWIPSFLLSTTSPLGLWCCCCCLYHRLSFTLRFPSQDAKRYC